MVIKYITNVVEINIRINCYINNIIAAEMIKIRNTGKSIKILWIKRIQLTMHFE